MYILCLQKIDGDKFTGFIIERGFEGFTQGPEEHKMGIKGSSTVQLYFSGLQSARRKCAWRNRQRPCNCI